MWKSFIILFMLFMLFSLTSSANLVVNPLSGLSYRGLICLEQIKIDKNRKQIQEIREIRIIRTFGRCS